jgi:hypothetical protein
MFEQPDADLLQNIDDSEELCRKLAQDVPHDEEGGPWQSPCTRERG